MPQAPKFKSGFGIRVGDIIGGVFKVVESRVGHVMNVQYRKYTYPISVKLKANRDVKGGEAEHLLAQLKGEKVIKSEYGNPYKCAINNLTYRRLKDARGEPSDDEFIVEGEGICVRVFD